MKEVSIRFDKNINHKEFLQVVSRSFVDKFVGWPDEFDRPPSVKKVKKILGRWETWKHHIGWMKIYARGVLVGYAMPFEVRDSHKEWLKLDGDEAWYRLGVIYIHPDHRGKGYASQAAQLFQKMYPRMVYTPRIDNEASRLVATRALGLMFSHLLYQHKHVEGNPRKTTLPNDWEDGDYETYEVYKSEVSL